MKTSPGLLVLLFFAIAPTSAMAQYHTDRGAVLGGLTGALAGAGIGDHNGEAGAGALIGGAVGLITGAAIGNSMDREEAQRSWAIQQQQAARLARAVSIADVVTMSSSGLGDDVIINHLMQNGVQRRLEVADVISLHQQGVSKAVITAMQRAPVGGPPVSYQTPVIVREHHYVSPPVYYWHRPPPYPYPYHHPHHPSGFHWGVGGRL